MFGGGAHRKELNTRLLHVFDQTLKHCDSRPSTDDFGMAGQCENAADLMCIVELG
ncbi:hypothetical protein D3C73_1573920 [compost metagenome]